MLILLLAGCQSRYLRRDEQGRLISLDEIRCESRPTEFERSLCESFDNLYDKRLVELCIRRQLLAQLAQREGPGSSHQRLLDQLDSLHVVYDSSKVEQVFREGLAEMNRTWPGEDSAGLDREIEGRADQLLKLRCFLPENIPHFDELGKLILQHGQMMINDWTEKTMVVTFADGKVFWIGEDEAYRHRILAVAESQGEMERIITETLFTGNSSGGLPDEGDDIEQHDIALGHQSDFARREFESWRTVDVPGEGEELVFNTINLHMVPTSYGDGLWNGKRAAGTDDPWDWSRCLIDFYIDLEGLRKSCRRGDSSSDLTVRYEIRRGAGSEPELIAGEDLALGLGQELLTGGSGLSFRTVTLPFSSRVQDSGYYELWTKASCGDHSSVRRFPFHLREKSFELLVLDSIPSAWSGIPGCQRISRGRRGDSIAVLIPYRLSQTSAAAKPDRATVRLYLINNEDIRTGRVSVGGATPLVSAGDSVRAAPVGSLSAAAPASLVDSFEVSTTSPGGYLLHSFVVPRKNARQESLSPGRYTLGAEIISGESILAVAITNRLLIE